jgi:hypothetical protein
MRFLVTGSAFSNGTAPGQAFRKTAGRETMEGKPACRPGFPDSIFINRI